MISAFFAGRGSQGFQRKSCSPANQAARDTGRPGFFNFPRQPARGIAGRFYFAGRGSVV